jgi:hypothetical protein
MFMSAREIMSTHQAADWDMEDPWTGVPETEAETWHRKLTESQTEETPPLTEQVRAEGVQKPVHLSAQFGTQGQPQVMEGHHRVVSSAATGPDRLMPVIHHETPDSVGQYLLNYE